MHTLDEVKELAKQVVAENPNKINPWSRSMGFVSCHYTKDDQHCIAGEIFFRLGIDLSQYDFISNTGLDSFDLVRYGFDSQSWRFLSTLQGHADRNFLNTLSSIDYQPTPWGIALQKTLETMDEENVERN